MCDLRDVDNGKRGGEAEAKEKNEWGTGRERERESEPEGCFATHTPGSKKDGWGERIWMGRGSVFLTLQKNLWLKGPLVGSWKLTLLIGGCGGGGRLTSCLRTPGSREESVVDRKNVNPFFVRDSRACVKWCLMMRAKLHFLSGWR